MIFPEVMDETDQRPMGISPKMPWRKWFAWRPVRTLSGDRVWLKRIYRQEIVKDYTTYDDWTRYKYGDSFDVLKDV